MIALTPIAVLVAASPSQFSHQPDAGRTAAALAIVAVVLVAAVVTETIRYRRRRHVHHPVPLSARRTPAPVVRKERRNSDLARRAQLVAHRS